jgi:hypothetical protein
MEGRFMGQQTTSCVCLASANNNVFKVTGSPESMISFAIFPRVPTKAFEFLRQFVLLFFAVTVIIIVGIGEMAVEPTCREKRSHHQNHCSYLAKFTTLAGHQCGVKVQPAFEYLKLYRLSESLEWRGARLVHRDRVLSHPAAEAELS